MESAKIGYYIHLEKLFLFLHCEGGKVLEQVAQRSGGHFIPWSVQAQDRALSNLV